MTPEKEIEEMSLSLDIEEVWEFVATCSVCGVTCDNNYGGGEEFDFAAMLYRYGWRSRDDRLVCGVCAAVATTT